MAAGDRYKNGKPKDIVRHYLNSDKTGTICGRKSWGYGSHDVDDTDCLNCLKKLTTG